MKKSERLSEAVGELDEEIVEKADQRRTAKRARKFPLKITAVTAACLAAVIGVIALVPRGISAEALAEAVYPKAARYPGELGINRDKWAAERNARYESGERIGSAVNDFCQKTAEEFLSGDENRAYSP